MNTQLTLPFPEWRRARSWHARLLHLANAGPQDKNDWQDWKSLSFYGFKKWLLERFAVPSGVDLQLLKLKCRGCGGGGIYYSEYSDYSAPCDRCGGSGVYRRDLVKLQRWDFAGSVFHVPGEQVQWVTKEQLTELTELTEGTRRELIRGVIQHAPVALWKAKLACLALMACFDRQTAADFVRREARSWWWNRQRDWRARLNFHLNPAWWALREWYFGDSRLATDAREWFGGEIDDVPF